MTVRTPKPKPEWKAPVRKHDWAQYRFDRSQLIQYMQIFTDKSDITVVDGASPSTHMTTNVVTLPVGSDNAQDVAAHEALHIVDTDNEAYYTLWSPMEKYILNVLDDARMERRAIHDRPGLKVQFQDNVVDVYMPLVLEDVWQIQAIKGIYILYGGYEFPRHLFKPKAKKTLLKFEKEILPDLRAGATTTSDLLPFVPRVLALFDEEITQPKPKPQPEPEEGQDDDEPEGGEGCDWGEPSDEGEDGDDPGEDGTGEAEDLGDGPKVVNPKTGKPMRHTDDEDCAACNELDRQEREGFKPRTYDADKVRNESESIRKMLDQGNDAEGDEDGGDDDEPDHPAPEVAPQEGFDTVTGGPTVNRLMQRARSLQKRMAQMDREVKHGPKQDPNYVPPASMAAGKKDRKSLDAVNADVPEELKGLVDLDKALDTSGRFMFNPADAYAKNTRGGVGYYGTRCYIMDARREAVRNSPAGDAAEGSEARLRSTVNYLARQMEVLLNSMEQKGNKDRMRAGKIEAPRAYQMGGGRFDVYLDPPNPSKVRPIVVLTTDMSGSMGGIGSYNVEPMAPAFHAMEATILLASALRRLGVPVEIHGFSSQHLYVLKTFSQPIDKNTIRAMSNLVALGMGGTPAAEALSFAWARAQTRPEERRIVIQVTDGAVPRNAQQMVKAIEKDGGLAIGVGIGSVNVESTFSEYITVQNASELPNRFARLLKALVARGILSE